MAKVKELKLNDEVALAGHTHTAGEVSYNSGSSYAGGTVGSELKTLGSSKVSTIDHDDSINVSTASPNSAANPKISVKISAESDNGLQLRVSGSSGGNPGLYVSKETLGLSSVYIPQGNIDISGATGSTDAEKQRNAAAALLADTTNVQLGYVYNIPYDGTIAESAASGAPDITVKVGDNIAVVEVGGVRKWDKLSATINATYSGGAGISVDESNRKISVDLASKSGLKLDDGGNSNPDDDKLMVDVGLNSGLAIDASSGNLKVVTSYGLSVGANGVQINTGDGLYVDGCNSTVCVKGGPGISVDGSSGVTVAADSNKGLELEGNQLVVKSGDGIAFDGDGRVRIDLDTNSGLQLANGSTGAGKLSIDLADSNPGLSIGANGIKVNGSSGVAVSGSNVVLHRRSVTSGNNTVDNSGLAIDSDAVYVNAGAGLEISGSTETSPGSVRVKLSNTAGRKNVNNTDGTYVSLDRAFDVQASSNQTLDGTYNPTIGEILAALGATMASAS